MIGPTLIRLFLFPQRSTSKGASLIFGEAVRDLLMGELEYVILQDLTHISTLLSPLRKFVVEAFQHFIVSTVR